MTTQNHSRFTRPTPPLLQRIICGGRNGNDSCSSPRLRVWPAQVDSHRFLQGGDRWPLPLHSAAAISNTLPTYTPSLSCRKFAHQKGLGKNLFPARQFPSYGRFFKEAKYFHPPPQPSGKWYSTLYRVILLHTKNSPKPLPSHAGLTLALTCHPSLIFWLKMPYSYRIP